MCIAFKCFLLSFFVAAFDIGMVPNPRDNPELCLNEKQKAAMLKYSKTEEIPFMWICDMTHEITPRTLLSITQKIDFIAVTKRIRFAIAVVESCGGKNNFKQFSENIHQKWLQSTTMDETVVLVTISVNEKKCDVIMGRKVSCVFKSLVKYKAVRKAQKNLGKSDLEDVVEDIVDYLSVRMERKHKKTLNDILNAIYLFIFFGFVGARLVGWCCQKLNARREKLNENRQYLNFLVSTGGVNRPLFPSYCLCCGKEYPTKMAKVLEGYKMMYSSHFNNGEVHDEERCARISGKLSSYSENNPHCRIRCFNEEFTQISVNNLLGKQLLFDLPPSFYSKCDVTVFPACGHMMHTKCYKKWEGNHHKGCPFCLGEEEHKNDSNGSSSASNGRVIGSSIRRENEDGKEEEKEKENNKSAMSSIKKDEKDEEDVSGVSRRKSRYENSSVGNGTSMQSSASASSSSSSAFSNHPLVVNGITVPPEFIRNGRPNFIEDRCFVPPAPITLDELTHALNEFKW
ncbi:uncharacterized protein MONOS_11931 [Monocercomonoides exilis]|uniref:uncharacterized protein n=1 Tax=Monocercomonoides exilis TaxID=2049356 RepID=UPI003559EB8F|nr:hypothetical protein MONOS_11931 [Monocercomonoides exilis]|eukprot:MONOS_11931.1-p1 / transcript=MONOS_11931.1 / gene=MONOS_11931 / organism=Monocercomonoides_exilis_PA203 / gene_product=unspecified product / transcript_product=unspecified product / location=Mono_scaffold00626:29622-31876(-) / protein_length=513 / sequence_SO=supercontig / SO=protein_coding / is_pseudo=false